MNGDRIASILGSIVFVALVTTIVAHKNTSKIVSSLGGAFSSSIRAAMGR